MIPQDNPDSYREWKGIAEDFFMPFLEFFHPDFVPQVDTSMPFIFLDNPDSYRDN